MNTVIVILLAAILVTLLGAWGVIGYSMITVLVLGIIITALFYIFSSISDSEIIHSLRKFIRIHKLKKIIKMRNNLGYPTEEYESQLSNLKKK